MKIQSLLVLAALALAGSSGAHADATTDAVAAATPAPAAVVRQGAEDQAAREGKAVFIEFHASWCIWCKRLHAMINDPAVKPVWDRHFVTAEIDSQERAGKFQLENAG